MKLLILTLALFTQLSFAAVVPVYQTKVSDIVAITATTTSTLIVAESDRRKFLFIQNVSGDTISIKFSSVHSADEGIKLAPGAIFNPPIPPMNAIYIKALTTTAVVNIYSGI